MLYHSPVPRNNFPRLVVERSRTLPGSGIGFLQMDSAGKRIRVGDTTSREFKLMQCLFSPHNFFSAKYEPVVQTHERVFSAIRTKAGVRAHVSDQESAQKEMTSMVERSLRDLQKGEVGEHFTFLSQEGKVRMVRV